MKSKDLSRRSFIGKSAIGLAGAAIAVRSTSTAASYKRIPGANDRVNIGFLGCGSRGNGHQNMVKMSEKDKNLNVVAVCDIWKHNREKAAANCKNLFSTDVKQFKYSEDMLKMPELDAVMIATGDFQHAKILAEVVRQAKTVIVKNQWRKALKRPGWPGRQCFLQNRLYKSGHNG